MWWGEVWVVGKAIHEECDITTKVVKIRWWEIGIKWKFYEEFGVDYDKEQVRRWLAKLATVSGFWWRRWFSIVDDEGFVKTRCLDVLWKCLCTRRLMMIWLWVWASAMRWMSRYEVNLRVARWSWLLCRNGNDVQLCGVCVKTWDCDLTNAHKKQV